MIDEENNYSFEKLVKHPKEELNTLKDALESKIKQAEKNHWTAAFFKKTGIDLYKGISILSFFLIIIGMALTIIFAILWTINLEDISSLRLYFMPAIIFTLIIGGILSSLISDGMGKERQNLRNVKTILSKKNPSSIKNIGFDNHVRTKSRKGKQIFISYAGDDGLNYAKILNTTLTNGGHDTFFFEGDHIIENRLYSQIGIALYSCRLVALIITNSSHESEDQKDEYNVACSRKKGLGIIKEGVEWGEFVLLTAKQVTKFNDSNVEDKMNSFLESINRIPVSADASVTPEGSEI